MLRYLNESHHSILFGPRFILEILNLLPLPIVEQHYFVQLCIITITLIFRRFKHLNFVKWFVLQTVAYSVLWDVRFFMKYVSFSCILFSYMLSTVKQWKIIIFWTVIPLTNVNYDILTVFLYLQTYVTFYPYLDNVVTVAVMSYFAIVMSEICNLE